ncbi:MAG: hypothetical protein DCF22_11955 [Leptolyngbya sp.]|nr:MAG: hypothetical protein DCF22_11955 [Leptolyngbya sp.]
MPSELANTSLATAFNMGNMSGSINWNWNSAIDGIDPNQYYRFSLSNSSSLNLSMSALQANANLDLLNNSGGLIASSANSGILAESLNRQLAAGTYYIRVSSIGGANTSYKLGLQGSGAGVDPGSNISSALDFGSFTTNTSRSWGESVSTSDTLDLYRVNLVQYSNLSLSLNNLSANADLQLLDSAGAVLASSSNTGTASESMIRALNAGTYFVRVNSVNSNTPYTLSTATSFINAAPTSLQFNLNKASFSNTETLTISSGQVWDNNGTTDITRIDFRLLRPDNTWIDVNDALNFTPSGTDNRSAGFNYSLNLSGYGSGNYTLQAIAYDKAGAASNVVSKNFIVQVPNQAPTSLQFGLNKTTFLNTETLSINNGWVFDGNGASTLSRVDFRLMQPNGTWIDISDATSFTTAPNPNWGAFSYSLNLGSYSAGNYALSAIAYDKSGAISNTVSQNFTIQVPNQAPTSLQFGLNKTTFLNTETLSINNGWVFDGNGASTLSRVDFRLMQPNGTWIDISDATSFTTAPNPNWGAFSYSLNLSNYAAGNYTLWAVAYDKAGAISNSLSQSFVVQIPVINDWFSLNLKDKELIDLTRNLAKDGQLNRTDMIAIFRNAEDGNVVDASELTDLRTLIINASRFNIDDSVRVLSNKVVNGDVANQWYTGGGSPRALGNLYAGSSGSQMEDLISKWFLGLDRPSAISSDRTTAYQYRLATPAFSVNGITYQDIQQGDVGDCYFLAGLGELALRSPNAIYNAATNSGMFIDNYDGTYTVRFFKNDGVADYVTVDRYLPVNSSGGFAYANASTELWVALAEKAYAQMNESGWIGQDGTNSFNGTSLSSTKVLRNEAGINYGWDSKVFQQLTGRATYYSGTLDFTAMVNAAQSGNLLGVSSKLLDSVASNVVPNHAYVVTGYNPMTQKFTLFNPWGVNGGFYNGSKRDGILELSWSQLTASFDGWTRTA